MTPSSGLTASLFPRLISDISCRGYPDEDNSSGGVLGGRRIHEVQQASTSITLHPSYESESWEPSPVVDMRTTVRSLGSPFVDHTNQHDASLLSRTPFTTGHVCTTGHATALCGLDEKPPVIGLGLDFPASQQPPWVQTFTLPAMPSNPILDRVAMERSTPERPFVKLIMPTMIDTVPSPMESLPPNVLCFPLDNGVDLQHHFTFGGTTIENCLSTVVWQVKDSIHPLPIKTLDPTLITQPFEENI